MENHSAPSGKTEWTLADFLSTYRYWALFVSSLLLAIGGQGLSTILPAISRVSENSVQTIAIFYLGSNLGWVVGAFLAFVVASRHGRSALIAPILVCALITISFLPAPWLWGSPAFLFLFGLAFGTVRAVFPLALAICLVGGRPGKIDFGCALTLMSTPILASAFAPVGVSWLHELDQAGLPVVLAFLACLLLPVILLLPVRNPAFDEPPRLRHKPLSPRRRSPLLVALILITPPVLIVLMSFGFYVWQANDLDAAGYSPVTLLPALLVLGIITAAVVIYFAYWVYRIHGELAGARPSQRLLTPLAAMLIAIFIPLGLPVLVMTLGDLLNSRGRGKGQGPLISIAWLAIWSLILPPIALALIQNAANKSYDMGSDTA